MFVDYGEVYWCTQGYEGTVLETKVVDDFISKLDGGGDGGDGSNEDVKNDGEVGI